MGFIQASDGLPIPITWNRNGYEAVLLYCHGITSERDEDGVFSDFHDLYFKNTADSFYFDFRGHGESELSANKATIAGMGEDFRTCINNVVDYGYKKIIIVAASFGASIVLIESAVLEKLDIQIMVFWNPVISYEDTFVFPKVKWARSFFPGTEPRAPNYSLSIAVPGTDFIIGPEMAREIATLHPERSKLPKQLKLLCVHGTADEHVPYITTQNYCLRYAKNVEFRSINGAAHGFAEHLDKLYQVTYTWLKNKI